MRWIIIVLFMLVSKTAPGAEPFARATIETQGNIVPGQQIRVLVEVFAPNFFTSPPQFPLFDLPDTLVTIPDERAQNTAQTIDDVEYAGIQRSYAVVPERPGTYTLPPLRIDFGYSVDGKPIKSFAVTNGATFNVSVSTEGVHGIAFAAKGLTLTQSYDREPATLKKGDALVRTITIFAEDTQAMMIPALETGSADGLTQYIKPPQIADDVQIDRSHGSSRTETITYMAEKQGSFVIPGLSYSWFDLDNGTQQIAVLPSVNVIVAPTSPTSDHIAPELQNTGSTSTVWGVLPIFATIGLMLIVYSLWRFKRQIMQRTRQVLGWLKQYKTSRHVRLRHLRSTIMTGDDQSIYIALQNWSQCLGHRSLDAWLDAQQSQQLRAEVTTLERRLFRSKDVAVDKRALAALVGAQAARTQRSRKPRLPELNPL